MQWEGNSPETVIHGNTFCLKGPQIIELKMSCDWKVAGLNLELGQIWLLKSYWCLYITYIRKGWAWAAYRSVLEQDTEPQIAPDVQLAPCMVSVSISVWMCVWMGECGKCCKVLWVVGRLEKRYMKCKSIYHIMAAKNSLPKGEQQSSRSVFSDITTRNIILVLNGLQFNTRAST